MNNPNLELPPMLYKGNRVRVTLTEGHVCVNGNDLKAATGSPTTSPKDWLPLIDREEYLKAVNAHPWMSGKEGSQ